MRYAVPSLAGCSLAYQAHLPCVEPAVYLLRTVLSAVPDAAHLLYDEHNLADVAVILHICVGGSRFSQGKRGINDRANMPLGEQW